MDPAYLDQSDAVVTGDREEAARLWRGYLFSPRISPDLLHDLKPALLQAPTHRNELGESFKQLCYLLVVLTCIELPESFEPPEKRDVIHALGPDGLEHGLWVLERRLANASEGAAELWRSRVGPWVDQAWPASAVFYDESLLRRFDALLLETREAFPEAVDILRAKGLIQPHAVSEMAMWLLSRSAQSTSNDEKLFDYVHIFPSEVVIWLECILENSKLDPYQRKTIGDILSSAILSDPQLVDLQQYQRLVELSA